MSGIFQKSYFQIGILLILKLILSLFFIRSFSIDLDEPFSIFYSQQSIPELFTLFENENNPPLHFVLLHFWIEWFGISPAAVRSLSLIFGLFTIPLIYRAGQKTGGNTVGLIAGFFFVFSNFHFYHDLEARPYPLLVFGYALLILLLLKANKEISVKNHLVTGLTLSALFYTHYISPVIIAATGCMFLYFAFTEREKKKRLQRITQLVLVLIPTVLITSAPILRLLALRVSHVNETGTWVPAAQWTELYGQINKFFNGKYVMIFLLLWGVFFLYEKRKFLTSLFTRLNFRHPATILSLFFLVTYLPLFGLSFFWHVHLFLDRYLFFLSLPLYLIVAYFFTSSSRTLRWAALFPVFTFCLFFNPGKGNNRETDKIAEYLKTSKGSILISPPTFDLTLIYHYNPEWFQEMTHGKDLFPHNLFPVYSMQEIPDTNALIFPIQYLDADSKFGLGNEQLRKQLDEMYLPVDSKSFKGNYSVIRYEKKK